MLRAKPEPQVVRARRDRDCYADEHFVPVLLAAHGLDNETTCAGNTMSVLWSMPNGAGRSSLPLCFGNASLVAGNKNKPQSDPSSIRKQCIFDTLW